MAKEGKKEPAGSAPAKGEKPKAEKPKGDKPKAQKPKGDKPKAQKPKVENPKGDKHKGEKGPKAKKAKLEKGESKTKGVAKGGKQDTKERKSWRVSCPLFERRAKDHSIGNDILRTGRDLTRFVKWPKYIRIQRQKRILKQRLKVPPAINQFSKTLFKSHAYGLFRLLNKYRPETRLARAKRLKKLAEAKAKEQPVDSLKRPIAVTTGINAVTTLVEKGLAKLVVIANNVDPIEIVLWLPTLCRKKDIPYVIVKDKSRLGKLVGKKTCAVLALTEPRKEDKNELAHLATIARKKYNDDLELRRRWGGGVLPIKHRMKVAKFKRLLEKEEKLRSKAAASK